MKSSAEALIGRRFSTAMGWKMSAAVKSTYFADFLVAASSATSPMPVAAVSVQDAANVLATVTSQTRGFPPCHGIKVSPSGRLPSRLLMPEGSLVAGIPAALRARQILFIYFIYLFI